MELPWSTAQSVLAICAKIHWMTSSQPEMLPSNASKLRIVERTESSQESTDEDYSSSSSSAEPKIVRNKMRSRHNSSKESRTEFSEELISKLEETYKKSPMIVWMVIDAIRIYAYSPSDSKNINNLALEELKKQTENPTHFSTSQEVEFVSKLLKSIMESEGLFTEESTINELVEKVYTWEEAKKAIETIENRLSQKVGRPIHFDEKNINELFSIFQEEKLGFWSILDQIQANLMELNWTDVRSDVRLLQYFIQKYHPINFHLSVFMQSIIPRYPGIPVHVPPHACCGVPHYRRGADGSDSTEFYDGVYCEYFRSKIPEILNAIEVEFNKQTMPIEPIKFDSKHIEYLSKKFDSNPRYFPLHLSKIFKKLLRTRWILVNNPKGYIQSLISHPDDTNSRIDSFVGKLCSQCYIDYLKEHSEEKEHQ